MAYNDAVVEEGFIDINSVLKFIRIILKKWWIIVLLAITFCVGGFVVAKITYTPVYTIKTTFTTDNKTADVEGAPSQYRTSSDISASEALARNLAYMLNNNNLLHTRVAEVTGLQLTPKQVKSMASASMVTETQMVDLKVKSSNPETAYLVAKGFEAVYSEITSASFANVNFTISDPATPALSPDSDMTSLLYTIIGLFAGAFFGVLIVLILNKLKNTFQSADELSGKLGTKVLVSVAHVNKKKGDIKSILVTDKVNGLPFIETYKLLRTKIENVSVKKGYKSFVISSALENEGKTTVAINISLSLAKSGKSVLLIDADLRKPAVYKALSVPAGNDRGLCDVVNGTKSLEESIKYVEKFNLYLLISGTSVADPSEILSSPRTKEIINAAKKDFDYVIIDSAPAGVVADAAILSNFADAAIMVVREDTASLQQVEYAMGDLTSARSELFGCIYNDAVVGITGKTKRRNGYFSGSYGYNYSYGYGESARRK
ncbi:MAG: polysaccharide biosynthesis tyrosine autokinase [Clostridiales bacterium]|nr:polysaccharide biosynthesis tyrosine autokinase [Clostridiales bacterium]